MAVLGSDSQVRVSSLFLPCSVTNVRGHRTALSCETLTLAWESPASLPCAGREATTSQPAPKAERKARCRHKIYSGKVLGKRGQWWGTEQ